MNTRRTVLALLLLLVLPIQGFAMGRMAGCGHAGAEAHVLGELDSPVASYAHAHPDALGPAGHENGPAAASLGTAALSDPTARPPWNSHPCSHCSLCAMCGPMLVPVSAGLHVSSSDWMRPAGAMHLPVSRDLGSLFRPPLAPAA